MRPTRRLGRAALMTSAQDRLAVDPFWPCSGWGLPSRPGHPGRWWSLTPPFHPCPGEPGRSVFCGTFPRVTPGGCYPPPRPSESGLSSTVSRRGRPADSSMEQATAAQVTAWRSRPVAAPTRRIALVSWLIRQKPPIDGQNGGAPRCMRSGGPSFHSTAAIDRAFEPFAPSWRTDR